MLSTRPPTYAMGPLSDLDASNMAEWERSKATTSVSHLLSLPQILNTNRIVLSYDSHLPVKCADVLLA